MFEDGTIFNELFIERLNYIIYVILLLIGLHGMIAKNNLIKKLIGRVFPAKNSCGPLPATENIPFLGPVDFALMIFGIKCLHHASCLKCGNRIACHRLNGPPRH